MNFSVQICPKKDLGFETEKNSVRIKINIFETLFRIKINIFETLCVPILSQTFTFLAQICPKRKFKFEIQATNVGIRISIPEIPCAPIFRQNEKLLVFVSIFAQKWILGSKFQKSKSGFGISILEILSAPIFRQNGQL